MECAEVVVGVAEECEVGGAEGVGNPAILLRVQISNYSVAERLAGQQRCGQACGLIQFSVYMYMDQRMPDCTEFHTVASYLGGG